VDKHQDADIRLCQLSIDINFQSGAMKIFLSQILFLPGLLCVSVLDATEPDSNRACPQNRQTAAETSAVDEKNTQPQDKPFKPGEVAPQFWGHTAGGEVYDYGKSFKGKTILLIFWSMKDPDNEKLNQKLRQIRNQFLQNKNLIMVSQCVDQDFAQWMQYCEQQKDIDGVKFYNDSRWIQQTQGGFDLKEINSAQDFGVEKTPAFFLIGPDRKFLGVDIPQKDLESFLTKTFKKQAGAQ
jgi:hypothetical protein